MSAWIVEDRTINVIVTWLYNQPHTDWTREQLKELGFPVRRQEDLPALGKALFDLNVEAVRQRYPDSDFRLLEYNYRVELAQRIHVYKAARCWLYQTLEGNIPDNPLYNIMDDWCNGLAHSIIADTADYQTSAFWR